MEFYAKKIKERLVHYSKPGDEVYISANSFPYNKDLFIGQIFYWWPFMDSSHKLLLKVKEVKYSDKPKWWQFWKKQHVIGYIFIIVEGIYEHS